MASSQTSVRTSWTVRIRVLLAAAATPALIIACGDGAAPSDKPVGSAELALFHNVDGCPAGIPWCGTNIGPATGSSSTWDDAANVLTDELRAVSGSKPLGPQVAWTMAALRASGGLTDFVMQPIKEDVTWFD
jgi:hypothetical protein